MDTTEHSAEQTRSNPGKQPAEQTSAHITFPPVLDSEKASRHELRKKWRGPLYQLPLGVFPSVPTHRSRSGSSEALVAHQLRKHSKYIL